MKYMKNIKWTILLMLVTTLIAIGIFVVYAYVLHGGNEDEMHEFGGIFVQSIATFGQF